MAARTTAYRQRHSGESSEQIVGIIGGGQLARLSAPAARRLRLALRVLDPSADAPAARAGVQRVDGRFDDRDALRALVEQCDVTTFETENVDVDVLIELADRGHRIVPDPLLMRRLTNKLEQKRMLRDLGFAVPEFIELNQPSVAALREFGLPAVLKRQRGGYDGGGVLVLRPNDEPPALWREPSLVEAFVEDAVELAVLVARTAAGDTLAYPVVEMVFSPQRHLLDYLIVPADQPKRVVDAARDLALSCVRAMDGVGLFAVELFLNRTGELLINEIAPRAHNSGHYTIEACATSQFEQHLRAVTGRPLGCVKLRRPAAMINVLGSPGFRGPSIVEGLDAAQAGGAAVHLYDKAQCWPGRKMGHVTALGDTTEVALRTARDAASRLCIRGAMPL